MKVYNKDGVSMTVAKEQVEDVLASDCWFKTKPELKEDTLTELDAEKGEAEKGEAEKGEAEKGEASEKEAKVSVSKPKKIRKVTPKKK